MYRPIPMARPSVKLCSPSPMMTIHAADATEDDDRTWLWPWWWWWWWWCDGWSSSTSGDRCSRQLTTASSPPPDNENKIILQVSKQEGYTDLKGKIDTGHIISAIFLFPVCTALPAKEILTKFEVNTSIRYRFVTLLLLRNQLRDPATLTFDLLTLSSLNQFLRNLRCLRHSHFSWYNWTSIGQDDCQHLSTFQEYACIKTSKNERIHSNIKTLWLTKYVEVEIAVKICSACWFIYS